MPEMGVGRNVYMKHNWSLVERWMDISSEEAYLRAEKIMTGDFNVARVVIYKQWPTPCEKKIGPWARKSMSC